MSMTIALEAFLTLPRGLLLTLVLTFASLAAGFAVSVPLAFLRASSNPWASAPVLAYTYAFRGTPLLVQLFLIYYGIGQLPLVRQSFLWAVMREPFWCAFIAFTLNSAAHTTEVLRGGIQAVPRGQIEAAKSLGLSRFHTARLIVFPLTLRIALPAYANEVVGMLKASSLASTITLLEVTGLARQLVSETFAPYEVFIAAGAFYLLLTLLITQGFQMLETRWTPTANRPPPAQRVRRRADDKPPLASAET
ncbi:MULTISPECIES: ABC transporter permease [Rhizobium]|uniref:Octopine/nopaline transport system permease protein n=1 Tax=Rhizobium aethiopicum TaxID=1138170 RepID=A0A7W6VR04_9HYPH|nr:MULTISPECIES: ABC transporter permease [Rhizobium]ARO26852.1 nopaline ABC transporter permease protein NocM [Rhizobium sp. TAL182]ARQ60724.1 nopaline ABC transporter permease protein NocM [Rhizobium sp. Kim5]MBB4194518.1 octopine/nopaline transport system permease protein [Rhizobium aethiopicum]MBB4582309.1 octopine/nopaline transport system permease protein [Rhizobium aethiopicum]PCD64453.1 ABC transporter permease [Rhizobium phaseoli]